MKVQNHSCVTICQKKKIFHKETETEYESLCVMFTALNGLVLHSCDDNSDSASMRNTFTQFSMLLSSSLSLLSVSRTVNWDVIIFHWLIINNTCLSLLCWRIKGFLVTAQHSSAQLHCCLIISTLESAEAASQCCSTTLGLTLPANTNQALHTTTYQYYCMLSYLPPRTFWWYPLIYLDLCHVTHTDEIQKREDNFVTESFWCLSFVQIDPVVLT